jgi:hypothetical protein
MQKVIEAKIMSAFISWKGVLSSFFPFPFPTVSTWKTWTVETNIYHLFLWRVTWNHAHQVQIFLRFKRFCYMWFAFSKHQTVWLCVVWQRPGSFSGGCITSMYLTENLINHPFSKIKKKIPSHHRSRKTLLLMKIIYKSDDLAYTEITCCQ